MVRPELPEHGPKAHLVDHALDIRHTDLEGGVDVGPAVHAVDPGGVFPTDQPLPVEVLDLDLLGFLAASILPHGVLGAVILYGHHRHIVGQHPWILHHHDAVGIEDIPVHPGPAGEHEAIIGVQLGELA